MNKPQLLRSSADQRRGSILTRRWLLASAKGCVGRHKPHLSQHRYDCHSDSFVPTTWCRIGRSASILVGGYDGLSHAAIFATAKLSLGVAPSIHLEHRVTAPGFSAPIAIEPAPGLATFYAVEVYGTGRIFELALRVGSIRTVATSEDSSSLSYCNDLQVSSIVDSNGNTTGLGLECTMPGYVQGVGRLSYALPNVVLIDPDGDGNFEVQQRRCL